ncbi:MAG: DUF350 domain-containing protein [Chloroflexi bacterium]|nr:DUF350 domain-containing protein [Chloroflexota bacterium]
MDLLREGVLLGLSIIYAVLGIVLLSLAFKVFDWLTPTNLADQIFHEKNLAAAVMAGAFLLSLALIIAAAIQG